MRSDEGGSSAPRSTIKNGGGAASILASRPGRPIHLMRCLLAGVALLATSCAAPDTRHHVIISVPQQRMALLDNGALLTTYPVSTSKFAIGDWPGSRGTPLGELEIAEKIGASAPSGAVFKDRRRTGEILSPDAPGRDPIVTRILWLRGRETQNANAYGRYIYIHGTPEERNIGRPASYGCVRMRSRDVIQLYDIVGPGAKVTIVNEPLEAVLPNLNNTPQASGGQPASR
jgi:lipoprotein-anchoring transpeptidase ErfK/SrfK